MTFEHGYALLIGVDENQVPARALPIVAHDVRELQRVLTAPDRCGYPETHVRTLTGAAATHAAILEGLDWLDARLAGDPDATAIVYYSGHGVRRIARPGEPAGVRHFLVPYDTDLLPAGTFAARIDAMSPQRLLVVLDCCHAQGFGVKGAKDAHDARDADGAAGATAEGAQPTALTADTPELSLLGTGRGRAVLSSSHEGELSWTRLDGGMSVFTYHLVEALRGHPGRLSSGNLLLVTELLHYVASTVPATTQRERGAAVIQRPHFKFEGDAFPIAYIPSRAAFAAVEKLRAELETIAAAHTPLFTGRAWALRALADWRSDPGGARAFAVTGQPGSGKSALAAVTYAQPPGGIDAAHFCNSRDYATIVPAGFIRAIALQLAARHPAYAAKLEEIRTQRGLSADLSGLAMPPEDAFVDLIKRPLEALRETSDRPIVILVDSLDEALTYSQQTNIPALLRQIVTLPAGVRWILTTRPDSRLDALLGDAVECNLSDDTHAPQDQRDIRDFVMARLATGAATAAGTGTAAAAGPPPPAVSSEALERTAEAIARRAQGNFQYARFVADGVLLGVRSADDVASLPEGLDGIYADSLRRLLESNHQQWTRWAPLLALLAVATEPLAAGSLTRMTRLSESEVWSRLGELRQFLEIVAAGESGEERYRLYHESFGEFLRRPRLLGPKPRPNPYYTAPRDAHRLIVRSYLSDPGASTVDVTQIDWARADGYGLRRIVHHAIASEEYSDAALRELIAPAFVSEKIARGGGEAAVVDDLGLAFDAARTAQDLVAMFRWSWLYVLFRDRIAYRVPVGALPLYVRAGKVDEALTLLGTLGRSGADDESERAMQELLEALAASGEVDRAMALAATIGDEEWRVSAQARIAEQVARHDPARALALWRRLSRRGSPALCEALAGHDAFVDDAIELATGRGEVLMTIARVAGARDLRRGCEIADRIVPFTDSSGAFKRVRDHETARAALAAAWAERDLPSAMRVVSELTNPIDRLYATIEVASVASRTDLDLALSMLRHCRQDMLPPGRIGYELALARFAAAGADAAEIHRLWDESAAQRAKRLFVLRRDDVDLLERLSIAPLRDLPAREITTGLLDRVVESLERNPPHFDNAAEGLAAVATALAMVSFERALALFDGPIAILHATESDVADRARLLVVKAIAPFDPDQAAALASRTRSYYQHLAHVAVVQAVAGYNRAAALRIIDEVDPRYAKTKTILLASFSESLGPGERDLAVSLLARMPRYVQGDGFRIAARGVREALAASISGDGPPGLRDPLARDPGLAAFLPPTREAWVRLAALTATGTNFEEGEALENIYDAVWDRVDARTAWFPDQMVVTLPRPARDWPIVAAALVPLNPRAALALYHSRIDASLTEFHSDDWVWFYLHLLATIVGAVDVSDLVILPRLIEAERLRYGTHVGPRACRGVADVIDAIGQHDLDPAIASVSWIADEHERGIALARLLRATWLAQEDGRAPARYDALTRLALDPLDTERFYTSMVKLMAADDSVPFDVCASTLAALMHGDRDRFLFSLKSLVLAIRHRVPDAIARLTSDLDHVTAVISV